MRFSILATTLFGGAVALVGTAALASDGVQEINQACAVSSGCFAGDSAGFPVTISETGSYALTSNLVVPSEFVTGIQISANDVSIDLRGFALTQPDCLGTVVDCTPASGGGYGIQTFGSGVRGVTIRNGSVTGMGLQGVATGGGLILENVTMRWNRSGGVFAGPDSRIVGCSANDNAGDGIVVGPGSTVADGTANGNAGDGIRGSSAAAITGNVSDGNGANGVECLAHCAVSDNTVRASGLAGIRTNEESRVRDNVVTDSGTEGIYTLGSAVVVGNSSNDNGADGIRVGNASMVRDNSANSNRGVGDGIDAGSGSNVIGNVARSNAGFGLRAESTLVGFSENVFGNNNGGAASPQTSSGTSRGGNLCDTSASCP